LSGSRKKPHCDDSEVQAILDADAGVESPAWIYNEFSDVDLGDKRFDKRLIRTAGLLGSAPLAPINQACLDWRSTKAAYRMFDNEKASPYLLHTSLSSFPSRRTRDSEGLDTTWRL
jgi:hypothetical protein